MCGTKFLHQVLWDSLAKLCAKRRENPSTFVKVTYTEKFSGTFLCGYGV